jgi:hypothetical protein
MKNSNTKFMDAIVTPIIRALGLVLLFALASVNHLWAQDGEAEKIGIGIRLIAEEVVTVYGDKGHEPNFDQPYILHSDFYVRTSKDKYIEPSVPSKGTFVLIYLPGPPIADSQRMKFTDGACPPNQQRGLAPLDFNHIFWIDEKELDKNSDSYRFAPEFRFSRWSVGVLSVPFKYRFASKGQKRQFGAESTLGLSVSYDIERSRDFDQRFSAIFGAGFTAINPNSAFADDSTAKAKNIPGFSVSGGFVGYIKKVQIGAICGFDFADSDWAFDGKPWLALSVGYAFVTPQSAGKGNVAK